MLTPAQAYALASCWGSYIRPGDPGGCFYSFHAGDGRPVSEAHRRDLLGQLAARIRDREGSSAVTARRELRELRTLRTYYTAAPLRA